MGTRKNHKSKKSNKRFRKTRSKRQRGGTITNDELIKASKDGDIDAVRNLIDEEGADVTASNSHGWTALMEASMNGHAEIVTILLEEGADVHDGVEELLGNIIFVPLQLAIENGHAEIVRILIEHGANVNDQYSAMPQNTPLTEAASKGYTEIVEILLENGANVNANDGFRRTALMVASMNGYIGIVKTLLENGADLNAENWQGETAYDMAVNTGHEEVAKLLKKHIVAQTIPRHMERQNKRLQVGRVMDKKRMPGDLTYKIITEYFGGKRKTHRKNKKSKKSKRKGRKTRRK